MSDQDENEDEDICGYLWKYVDICGYLWISVGPVDISVDICGYQFTSIDICGCILD